MDRFVAHSLALPVLGFAFAVLTSACGGFSTEKAEARCDQEEEARQGGACFDANAYDACVLAYEECGQDVDISDSCPLSFTCSD